MKKILVCLGTRPNFIKTVYLEKLFRLKGYEYRVLHTGQHFDQQMSDVFFEQLELRKPDFYLGISAGTNSESVGKIIVESEKVFLSYKPDLVIVIGDVNSTFACAFAAASLRIPLAHIESGLRSGDLDMPEERNRILTDALSDLLFVTEPAGMTHLKNEGITDAKIKRVGNTIIDALVKMLPLLESNQVISKLGIKQPYCLATFHRPVNVDNPSNLNMLVDTILKIASFIPVVFPVHPRTLKKLQQTGEFSRLEIPQIRMTEPLGYIEFLKLMKESACLISDSGGVQIESSYFGIPCFTIRETTELRITLEEGTNHLMNLHPDEIAMAVKAGIQLTTSRRNDAWLWDGKASERIVNEVCNFLESKKPPVT
ncbi:MAG: non-hydrolyzing UDP-N-acetylglucosamine 2-epimerase [Bacteroidota bacterium]